MKHRQAIKREAEQRQHPVGYCTRCEGLGPCRDCRQELTDLQSAADELGHAMQEAHRGCVLLFSVYLLFVGLGIYAALSLMGVL